jgi:hypothetical protein
MQLCGLMATPRGRVCAKECIAGLLIIIAFKFASMVDVIDLTLSDDDRTVTKHEARPTPGLSLLLSGQKEVVNEPLRKRLRADSPPLGIGTRAKHRKVTYTQRWQSPYQHAVVRHVHVAGHIRRGDITLPEVLEVDTLHEAVLSSFSWDMDWLLSDIGLGRVDATFIADEKDQRSCALQAKRTPFVISGTHLWHCPPRRGSRGGVHGKLMVLFRKDGIMRIVIPTGNLRRADWGAIPTRGPLINGASDSLHNLVFMVDLPKRDESSASGVNDDSQFQRELGKYLTAMNVSARIHDRAMQYDFSACEDFGFVWTGYVLLFSVRIGLTCKGIDRVLSQDSRAWLQPYKTWIVHLLFLLKLMWSTLRHRWDV